ncbi:hypothetical protein ON010_g18303 [Phytophthora cinnamomi]|nr:hypothetical protein ON010_g18303 [Phytophthora cinnamomi]
MLKRVNPSTTGDFLRGPLWTSHRRSALPPVELIFTALAVHSTTPSLKFRIGGMSEPSPRTCSYCGDAPYEWDCYGKGISHEAGSRSTLLLQEVRLVIQDETDRDAAMRGDEDHKPQQCDQMGYSFVFSRHVCASASPEAAAQTASRAERPVSEVELRASWK